MSAILRTSTLGYGWYSGHPSMESHTAIPSAQQSISWRIEHGTQFEYWGQESHADASCPSFNSYQNGTGWGHTSWFALKGISNWNPLWNSDDGVMEICRHPYPNAKAFLDCIYHSQAPYSLPIHVAGHPRLHGISALSAFRSWLAIRWMVAPLPWPCSSCFIMVSPAMTISLFWNKCPSIATPRYSMSSSGVFLCLDLVSTRDKMTGVDGTVNRKKAKYHKIVRHNLRGIIESCHVLCGVFSRGLLRPPTAFIWALLNFPHFEDCWTFTDLDNVHWSYHR